MHWQDRNAIAQAALANARPSMSGYARANCPFCEARIGKVDRKYCLSYRSTSGWYRCWRCGVVGRLEGVGGEGLEQALAGREERVAPAPPEGYTPMADLWGSLVAEAPRGYLRGRGLPERVWYQAKLGACFRGKYTGRVIVPVLSPEGQWLGWVGRRWVDGCYDTYRNMPGMALGGALLNHAALLVETSEPVLVVEGPFDVLALWPHAVAVLGKPGEPHLWGLVAAKRPVVVVLDGDAWEEGWAWAQRLRLEGQRAGYVRLPPKADPDEVDRDWLMSEARSSLDAEL